MVRYVGVYIVHHDRLLVHKRHESLDGHLISPGGSVDPGETPLLAAIRETREEAGVDLEDLTLFYESPDDKFAAYLSTPATPPRVRGPEPASRDELDMDYTFDDFQPHDVVVLPNTGHAFVRLAALYEFLMSSTYRRSQRYFLSAVTALMTRVERLPYDVVFRAHHAFFNALAPPYIQAIKDYTSSDYYEDLNRKLCARLALSDTEQRIYDDLMGVFRSCPRLATPITVWRGLRAKELIAGRLACQFVSASYDLQSALRPEFTWRSCCLVQITVPAGACVLPLERLAEQAGEWEVLLPPNGTWTVLSETEEAYEGRDDLMRTYAVTYLPAGGVRLAPGLIEQNTRNVLTLTQAQNADRIAMVFNAEEMALLYDDREDPYGDYFRDIAEQIGALPMPPVDLIKARLP